MISIDDALALAAQVLADYDTATAAELPGADSGQAGRLAHALRDLTVAAAAWYGTPVPARPIGALTGVLTQCEQAAARLEAETVRLAARRTGRVARLRGALARLVWAWANRATRPVGPAGVLAGPAGTLAVPAGELAVIRQALADGLIWRSVAEEFTGADCGGQLCQGCRELGSTGCPFTGADDGLRDRYRGLLARLNAPPQQGAGS